MSLEAVILPPEQWWQIEPIVRGEFGDALPRVTDQATFLAAMDGEKVAGFFHVESLLHFNSLYVAREYRGNGVAHALVTEAVSRIPEGFSAVWLRPINEKGGRTARHFGGRKLGIFEVYRKDV